MNHPNLSWPAGVRAIQLAHALLTQTEAAALDSPVKPDQDKFCLIAGG